MGPLSAVAIAVWLLALCATWLTWITASLHVLGWLGIIVVVVILLDAFWIGSGPRYAAWRHQ